MEFTKEDVINLMQGNPSTKECQALYASGWWYKLFTPSESALLQFRQGCLCMPFSTFHGYFEELIGRPVYTHELGDKEALSNELKAKGVG